MEIQIEKAILHILDKNSSLPVYSQSDINLDDESVYKFISNNIKKLYDDTTTRRGKFDNASYMFSLAKIANSDFNNASVKIAEHMYKFIQVQENVPSSDLLIAIAMIGEFRYLAILKLNYKEGYTHSVDYTNVGATNRIILHRVIFGSDSSNTNEGVLINLNDMSLKVTEKTYIIDGEKKNYFSEIFLQCSTDLSKKESLKVVTDVAKTISKKYFDEDFTKVAEAKEAIYDGIVENGEVSIEKIAERTFGTNQEIKDEYIGEVKKAGVRPAKINLYGESPERKFSKCRIKTDNGIEVSVPMEIYKDKNNVEFINNSDGTTSILIKNVGKIINK